MRMYKFYMGSLLVSVLAMSFPLAATAQGIVMERQISMAMAQDAAQSAVEQCRANGFHVSVSIVDRAGNLKAMLRDDEIGPQTVEGSRRKASTAALFRSSTADLANRAQDPLLANLEDITDGLLFLGGGLPIMSGDEVIGGIGVSGAPRPDADVVCAEAGISRIADRL